MNRKLPFFLLMLIIPMLACGQLTVVNAGPKPVTVRVILPDGAYNISQIPAGTSKDWISFESGAYQVTEINDQEYLQEKLQLQSSLQEILNNPETAQDPNKVKEIKSRLDSVTARLDAILDYRTVCRGTISESDIPINESFELQEVITVVLNYDSATRQWACGE